MKKKLKDVIFKYDKDLPNSALKIQYDDASATIYLSKRTAKALLDFLKKTDLNKKGGKKK
ncbi:hypothetical protein J7K25_01020 [bacterium]|nr:hypothetical protein [bacterium]